MAIDLDALRNRVAEFDDGELLGPSLYTIWEPDTDKSSVVYSTKYHAAIRLLGGDPVEARPLNSHYGLPAVADLSWLRTLIRDRTVYFLGDFDPLDVLIFVAVREHLPMTYLSLTDNVLGNVANALGEGCTIGLSPQEQLAMQVLAEICPQYRALIGPTCAALWEVGRKLELKALATAEVTLTVGAAGLSLE